jgi:hypothetical protein
MIDYAEVAAELADRYNNKDELTWSELEEAMGLSICTTDDKSSLEWKGYVQVRNQHRQALNGAAMELSNSRKRFQIRPFTNDGERVLRFLKGDALFEDWAGSQQRRLQGATRRFKDVMQTMCDDFALPPRARSKARNYLTVAGIVDDVTVALVEQVLNDQAIQLPDYSRNELLRLTTQAADDSLMGGKDVA